MNKSEISYHSPIPDEIATRAYQIYEHEVRPEGRDFDRWLAAEVQLIAERAKPARSATTTLRSTSPPAPKPATPSAALANTAPRASVRLSATNAR